jgi:hypothetical protein
MGEGRIRSQTTGCHSEEGAAPILPLARSPARRPRNLLAELPGRSPSRDPADALSLAPCGREASGKDSQPCAESISVTGTSKRPSVMTMVLVSPVDPSVLTAVPWKVPVIRPPSIDLMVMEPPVNE